MRAFSLRRLVGSPDDPWSSLSAWRPVVVDADQPLSDLPVEGATHLWVTVVASGQPIGTLLLAATSDPLPAAVVSSAISEELTWDLHRERMRAALVDRSPLRPAPRSTVLVCSKDRPENLRACLASISRLEHAVDEVLVVDNGLDPDTTRAIADSFGARYVGEPLPGLDRARNRGVAEASGDVLLCTDDDVEVHPTWATALLACFEDPLVMAAGGLVLPARLDTPARWHFERHASFARGFVRRVLDGGILPPSVAGSTGAGASMALRADFVRSIGGFPEELDAGMPTESGGDTYMFYRVLRDGFRIVYEPAALALHTHRSTAAALERVFAGYGTGVWSWAIRALVQDRDPVTAAKVTAWATDYLGRKVAGSLVHRAGALPMRVSVAGVRGALAAPAAYRAARRTVASRTPVSVGESRKPLLAAPREHVPGLVAAPPLRLRQTSIQTVSVVIASGGRCSSLVPLLHALGTQDYPHDCLDVSVVLDRDGDASVASLGQAAGRCNVRVLLHEGSAPAGEDGTWLATARNRGAASATGDVLLFLDDTVMPGSDGLLSAHAEAHRRGPRAVVGPCTPSPQNPDQMLGRLARNWWVDHSERLLCAHKLVPTDLVAANLSIDRRVFDDLGGFAPLPRRDAWELGYRLAAAGVVMCAAPAATAQVLLDQRLGRVVDEARWEGIGDVAFARLHPEVLPRLPLAALSEVGPRGQRLARLGLRRGDRALPLAHRSLSLLPFFERAGMRHVFVNHLRRTEFLAYWAGVGSAANGLGDWDALLRAADLAKAPAPVFDLADRRKAFSDLDLELEGAAEVRIHQRGVPLGTAPMSWGGVPWNRNVFIETIVERFADLALNVDASSLTTVDPDASRDGVIVPAQR